MGKGFLGESPKQAGAIAEGKLHGKNEGANLMQSVCDRVLTGNLRYTDAAHLTTIHSYPTDIINLYCNTIASGQSRIKTRFQNIIGNDSLQLYCKRNSLATRIVRKTIHTLETQLEF